MKWHRDWFRFMGRVRGPEPSYNEGESENQFSLTRGNTSVSQAIPSCTNIVRHGASYHGITTAALAIVTSLPTTTAAVVLYNRDVYGGRWLVVDSIHAFGGARPAGARHWGLVGCISPSDQAAFTDDFVVRRLNGLALSSGQAGILDANATVVNYGWFPIGSTNNQSAVTASNEDYSVDLIDGQYIIPPKGFLALHGYGSSTSVTLLYGIRWHEISMPSPS